MQESFLGVRLGLLGNQPRTYTRGCHFRQLGMLPFGGGTSRVDGRQRGHDKRQRLCDLLNLVCIHTTQ